VAVKSTVAVRQDDEFDLVAFLRVLWEFKYIVIGTAMLFGIASVFYALTATPIFRADVVVTKVTETNMSSAASLASQFGSLGRLAGFNFNQGGPGREAQEVLQSRHLTQEFIERNNVIAVMYVGDGESQTLWQAVKEFRNLVLTIREDETEGTSVISIKWKDPDIAAKWANDYVALANELIRTRALQEAESNLEYLRQQAEETNVVELERVIYNLIQTQIQTLMLANARKEYAFTVVDPAVVPEERTSPRRKLIVISGGAIGVFLGVLLAFAINLFRKITADDFASSG
jgi:uncharacterized protein involved in exopolysaccharide biosynthesis